MIPSGSVAFFDLDRTLLAVNSASGWIRREQRLGFIPWTTAVRGAVWIGMYRMGFANMEDAIRSAVASLTDAEEAVIAERTRAFWHEEIVHAVRPGAIEALDRHRARGDALVLLTSSSPYLSALAITELRMDDYLCNRFEVREGRFTGEVEGDLCYGLGKLTHARRFAGAQGVPLTRCAFYTDSYSDIPVLEAVGEPVAVHPDPRLAREARRRGWRVETWN